MDTHSKEFPVSAPEALRRLVDQVLGSGDAILTAADGGVQDVLDHAAERLGTLRLWVLPASAAALGSLSLSGLMAQVAGQPDLTAQDDGVLDRGFQALTVPGAGCDGIEPAHPDIVAADLASRFVAVSRRTPGSPGAA